MAFDVSADAYGRFMGRFSEPLAVQFAGYAEVGHPSSAIDVGCGPGALTQVLADRLGPGNVAAVDPSESFVTAVRRRLPGVDVRRGAAEALPFDDDRFDGASAQLVVHFMTDPVAGVREMARVTRPGGVVAACVWDQGGGRGPLSAFWAAVTELDPGSADQAARDGTRRGQLQTLFERAGLGEVESTVLTVAVGMASFEDWWEPFTLGVGPAGSYVAGLSREHREALRARCAASVPAGPFEVVASAWTTRGRVPD